MESVRAQPVIRGGELAGLEIRPVRNRRDFERTGLQSGDIITSVEGQPVSAIENPEALASRLQGAGQIGITVERDGQTQSLTIELTE